MGDIFLFVILEIKISFILHKMFNFDKRVKALLPNRRFLHYNQS